MLFLYVLALLGLWHTFPLTLFLKDKLLKICETRLGRQAYRFINKALTCLPCSGFHLTILAYYTLSFIPEVLIFAGASYTGLIILSELTNQNKSNF